MSHGFQFLDFFLLGFYFLLVCYVGFRYGNDKKGIVEHFLAGRRMNWFFIGSSLFITTVSSEHVIGNPESGYAQGFPAAIFPWGGALALILVAWFFIPFYLKNNVMTTPEFIEKRFGTKCRWIVSAFSIFVYIITKISVTLFAGALLLEALLGWDKYTSSLILVVITGVFSVTGGFKGEMYSHVLHAYVTIFCATAVTIVGVHYIGGFDQMVHHVPNDYFELFRSSSDTDYPWTGILLGAPVLQVWYWGTDQFMMQRVLSAKDMANARRGAIFGSYLMVLVPFILLVPGLVAYVHYQNQPVPENVSGMVYLSLISDMLPTGVKALAVAGLLSALISSLTASFNSAASLYTLDMYTKLYPKAEEFKIVNIGKISTILVVNLAIVWVSFIGYFSDDIIKNLQTIQSYVAPPFATIFLVGMLWSRATKQGALAVLIAGLALGLFRIGIDLFKESLINLPVLSGFFEMNFLHQTIFFFWFYVILMVMVSVMTPAPDNAHLQGLTYKFRVKDGLLSAEDQKRRRVDIVLSVCLVTLLLLIWAVLTFLSI